MNAVAKAVEPADLEVPSDHIRLHYIEALTLVERLHRRLLDVIKNELDRAGRPDINSVQAFLLYNIGDGADRRRVAGPRRLPRVRRLLQPQEAGRMD